MTERKCYIAGPMTGIPSFNFPAFDDAKEYLIFGDITTYKDTFVRPVDWQEVFSPADHDRELLQKDYEWYPGKNDHDGEWKRWTIPDAPSLRRMLGDDLSWIAENATDMYMLKGWERSNGARAEHALAVALNLNIMYQ
jgi:hypothetical protein